MVPNIDKESEGECEFHQKGLKEFHNNGTDWEKVIQVPIIIGPSITKHGIVNTKQNETHTRGTKVDMRMNGTKK